MLLLKVWTRLIAFGVKDVTEVIRRPGALFSLVLGPFLVMALFGVGYSGQRRALDAVLVIPVGSDLPRDASFYQAYLGQGVRISDITDNVEDARARLQGRQIDLLIVAPADVEAQFRSGQQSLIGVEYNQIDPIRENYTHFLARQQVQELNQAIIARAVGEGRQFAIQSGAGDPITNIPPEVVAAPTRPDLQNRALIKPAVVVYFAPAVLALVLQHLGMTLTALSLVRERLGGAIDVFRVAPVRSLEIVLGKYLAYSFFNISIGALVSLLLIGPLGIPLLSDPASFALVVALLTFASLGLGLFISTIVDSERQAVQLSMLVLLASVFFGGFVLPLDEFLPFMQWVAYALPVTHGIQLLQDTMLRGSTNALWHLYALAGIGVGFFVLTTLALRHNLARG